MGMIAISGIIVLLLIAGLGIGGILLLIFGFVYRRPPLWITGIVLVSLMVLLVLAGGVLWLRVAPPSQPVRTHSGRSSSGTLGVAAIAVASRPATRPATQPVPPGSP
jgi:hypothetical protein